MVGGIAFRTFLIVWILLATAVGRSRALQYDEEDGDDQSSSILVGSHDSIEDDSDGPPRRGRPFAHRPPSGGGTVGRPGGIGGGSSSLSMISTNGGGNMIGGTFVNGASGMSQICNGASCQTCFNGRCFNRTFPAIRQQGMCPPIACEYGCIEFVLVGEDNCPTCRCNGFSTRELCESEKDCGERGGRCEKQLCRYPAIRGGSYSVVCDFSYQCPSDKECVDGRCRATSDGRSHSSAPCVFVFQCPSDFPTCRSMTCWKKDDGGSIGSKPSGSQTGGGTLHSTSGPDHAFGFPCTFDYHCPSGYTCRGMSCIRTGQSHGTSQCIFSAECNRGEECVNMTCRTSRG